MKWLNWTTAIMLFAIAGSARADEFAPTMLGEHELCESCGGCGGYTPYCADVEPSYAMGLWQGYCQQKRRPCLHRRPCEMASPCQCASECDSCVVEQPACSSGCCAPAPCSPVNCSPSCCDSGSCDSGCDTGCCDGDCCDSGCCPPCGCSPCGPALPMHRPFGSPCGFRHGGCGNCGYGPLRSHKPCTCSACCSDPYYADGPLRKWLGLRNWFGLPLGYGYGYGCGYGSTYGNGYGCGLGYGSVLGCGVGPKGFNAGCKSCGFGCAGQPHGVGIRGPYGVYPGYMSWTPGDSHPHDAIRHVAPSDEQGAPADAPLHNEGHGEQPMDVEVPMTLDVPTEEEPSIGEIPFPAADQPTAPMGDDNSSSLGDPPQSPSAYHRFRQNPFQFSPAKWQK